MGALKRPDVPPGPHRDLLDAIHRLHHRAGRPSLRDLARDVGVSRTTVAAVFSAPRLPRWGVVELLVESLGGNSAEYHTLWLAATEEPAVLVASATKASDRSVPHQLPAATTDFVGRHRELEELDRLTAASNPTPSPGIALVCGPPGVGKSALVVTWAHRHPAPDGELYLDLRGYDARTPMSPSAALERFLRGVGAKERAIPGGRAERAALWRSILAGRRMLLVLDNVRSLDQVRDLVPGSATSLALVTSRDTLPGLAVRYGALRLQLERLPLSDAVDLVTRLVGHRAEQDPVATAAMARLCGCLPIALRLACERALSRPWQPLAELVTELDHESDRLDLLDLGSDGSSAVRGVFSWSLAALDPGQRRAFRLMALAPPGDVDLDATTALLGVPRRDARGALDGLARLHLVEASAAGVRMHDLLRTYAGELLALEAPEDVEPGRARLVRHFVDRAEAALREVPSGPSPQPSTPLGSSLATSPWLEQQRANLQSICVLAADHRPGDAIRLSAALAAYLDARGHYADAVVIHESARRAAAAIGDGAAEAAACLRVALICRRLGEFAEATLLAERARALYDTGGDRAGVAAALTSMGIDAWRSGRYREARQHLEAARVLGVALGDRFGEAVALYNLGIVHRRLGDYPGAAAQHGRALRIQREIGDRVGEGRALANAGMVQLRLGNLEEALQMQQRALQIQLDYADRAGESATLTNVGLVLERQGRLDEALAALDRALAISRDVGYRVGEGDARRGRGRVLGRLGRVDEATEDLSGALAVGQAMGEADIENGALNDLAEVLLDAGRWQEARPALERARALAQASGDRYEQGRALTGLGRVADAAGEVQQARAYWRDAEQILADLGLPERAWVAQRLAGTGATTEADPSPAGHLSGANESRTSAQPARQSGKREPP
jgi:tetratricopeptide (TPR) repeat protein